jgi:hypothetical protein
MRPADLHFFPLAPPFVLGLFLLIGLLMALIEVGILTWSCTSSLRVIPPTLQTR